MVMERRLSQRRDVIWKAALNLENGAHLLGSTANVSRSGMIVIIDRELSIGEPLDIELFSRCTGPACYFRLRGVAVYNKKLSSNLGVAIGVELKDPTSSFIDQVGSLEQEDCWLKPSFALA